MFSLRTDAADLNMPRFVIWFLAGFVWFTLGAIFLGNYLVYTYAHEWAPLSSKLC